MQRLKKKLGSRGETLTETLAALLVAVIALALLAGMIVSSTRLIYSSRDRLDEYYTENNALITLRADNKAAIQLSNEAGPLRLTDEQSAGTISVVYYTNKSIGYDTNSTKGEVSAYRIGE